MQARPCRAFNLISTCTPEGSFHQARPWRAYAGRTATYTRDYDASFWFGFFPFPFVVVFIFTSAVSVCLQSGISQLRGCLSIFSRGFGLRSFRPQIFVWVIFVKPESPKYSEWGGKGRERGGRERAGGKRAEIAGRNLRTKTPQTEASGKCSSIFFAPPPSPLPPSPPLQIKLGGPSQ